MGRSWDDLGSIWVAQGGSKMSTASGQKRCDVEYFFEVKLSGVKRWKRAILRKVSRTGSFTPRPVVGEGETKRSKMSPKTRHQEPKPTTTDYHQHPTTTNSHRQRRTTSNKQTPPTTTIVDDHQRRSRKSSYQLPPTSTPRNKPTAPIVFQIQCLA